MMTLSAALAGITDEQERLCDEMAETDELRAAVAWRFFQGKGQIFTELTGIPLNIIEKFVKDGELSNQHRAILEAMS